MAVSDFYTARWPDFICISAHYKYVMMMMMMMIRSRGDEEVVGIPPVRHSGRLLLGTPHRVSGWRRDLPVSRAMGVVGM